MRTTTTTEQKVLNNADGYGVHCKVEVADVGGTFQDLRTLGGYNWIDDVEYSKNIDDQVATAKLTLGRDVYSLSLAPFITASKFNVLGPLLRPNAEVKISTATLPKGATPASGDWKLVFHGLIDTIDWAGSGIQVDLRDLGARLQKRYIRNEVSYSNSTGLPVESVMQGILDDNMLGFAWAASHSYGVGDRIRKTVSGTTYSFLCQGITGLGPPDTASGFGTSGSSEPTWPSTIGATVGDNNLTWRNDGGIGVTLSVPTSPSWAVKTFTQQKKSVLDALKDLADQIGWALRYVYDDTAGDFVLRFFDPRSGSSVWDLDSSHYLEVTKLAQSVDGVRNFVQVVYGDIGDLNPDGTAKRKNVWSRDDTSVAAYDEQWMELTEASTPNLYDHASAQTLANNVLKDLREPKVDHELSLHYFWPVELGDTLTCKANGIHYDSDQQLAVVSIDHHISMGEQRTTLGLRGTPAAQFNVWLERGARPGVGSGVKITGPKPPSGVTSTQTPGGASISFTPPTLNYAAADLHLSTTTGFTPSSTTLKQSAGAVQRFEVSDLYPGATYYGQIVAKDSKGNVSSTSGQFSFVAGYAQPGTLNPAIRWGAQPLNGDFESQLNSSAPPDHWTMITGTWGTDVALATGGFSGAKSLQVGLGRTAKLGSVLFPTLPGTTYTLSGAAKSSSGGAILGVEWFDTSQTSLGTSSTFSMTVGLSWAQSSSSVTAPTNAAYGRVTILATGTSASIFIDALRLKD